MAAVSDRIGRALRRGIPKKVGEKAPPATKAAPPAKRATPVAEAAPAKKAPAKKAPASKAPAKPAPATKAPAKKAPATKAPAKKVPVAKVPAIKKAAPVTKASAPAKKAVVKQAVAKQAAPVKKVVAKAAPAAKITPVKTAPVKTAPVKAPISAAAPERVHWTPAELKSIRAQLQSELKAMTSEYEHSITELNEFQQSSTDGAGDDQADAGSKTFEREQELSIAANRLDLLTQIRRAVERIDAGTYGTCESCGKSIPKARLKAFPMATLDVVCKQREERR
jgi:RNA polymerase-binding protein DksA